MVQLFRLRKLWFQGSDQKNYFWSQGHYREVPRWEIFMEQELRFGLDLGQMADFPAFIASKSFDLLAKKHFTLCLAPLETPHRGTLL